MSSLSYLSNTGVTKSWVIHQIEISRKISFHHGAGRLETICYFPSLDYQRQVFSRDIQSCYPQPMGCWAHLELTLPIPNSTEIWSLSLTYLSPLLLEMPTNFSMPPASRKALAFSMFLVITSCRVQQTAVTVSSDMALLAALLLLFPPGSLWTRSRMAYLPLEKKKKKSREELKWGQNGGRGQRGA